MPLKGIKVVELAGLAPGPFCGMILADFGASVVRIDRTVDSQIYPDPLGNGKRSIALNLKSKKGVEIFKKLCNSSDVLIDPFRRGVMEKLGLGPEQLMLLNSKLIYARLTGYGQTGPYADMAGHDINFLGVSGLLSLFGRSGEKPLAPTNLAADFGGGGLICALGIILALFERNKTNLGQIIDSSMVEGSAYLGSWLFRSQSVPGLWGNPRGENLLDSGAHFYDTYETKDGKYVAVGALEPQFYDILLDKLGLESKDLPQFDDFSRNRKKLSDIFKSKTQEEWCGIFDGTDACVTPVLDLKDASKHLHNRSRDSFITSQDEDCSIPNPAPILSRTPGKSKFMSLNPQPGDHTTEILTELGFLSNDISSFVSSGVVRQNNSQVSKL